MTERLPTPNRDRIRQALLPDIALWGVESEFSPQALETAVEIIAHHEPQTIEQDIQAYYTRTSRARKRADEDATPRAS